MGRLKFKTARAKDTRLRNEMVKIAGLVFAAVTLFAAQTAHAAPLKYKGIAQFYMDIYEPYSNPNGTPYRTIHVGTEVTVGITPWQFLGHGHTIDVDFKGLLDGLNGVPNGNEWQDAVLVATGWAADGRFTNTGVSVNSENQVSQYMGLKNDDLPGGSRSVIQGSMDIRRPGDVVDLSPSLRDHYVTADDYITRLMESDAPDALAELGDLSFNSFISTSADGTNAYGGFFLQSILNFPGGISYLFPDAKSYFANIYFSWNGTLALNTGIGTGGGPGGGTEVPEPSTLSLLAVGAFGAAMRRRRQAQLT